MSTIVYLVLAGAVGASIGAFRATRPRYTVAACALAALTASVTLSLPLGDMGPHLVDVAVWPAAAGALAGAALMRLTLSQMLARPG